MAKTQSPATVIAQACQLLAQASQQLATLAAAMNGDSDTGEETPKRRGRPPAAAKVDPIFAKAEEKKAVKFTPAEVEKIKLLMSCGEDKQDAMKKVFNLRGGSKSPAAKTAPTVKVAPKAAPKKKAAIRMITRDDVENDSYTLAEFRAHLKENGIEKGTDDYATLNTKFLELRKRFKDEIEEENSVEEPEMTDDDQLMGEFETEGSDSGFDFSEE